MRRLARYVLCARARAPSLTCKQDWLSRLTAKRKEVWPALVDTYGEDKAATWFYRWQIFYMACAELFAYDGGNTWGVSHYLFQKLDKSR